MIEEPIIFVYKFFAKFFNSLIVTAYIVFGVGFSVYALSKGAPGLVTGLTIVWVVLAPLILFSLWAVSRERKLYSPIKINKEGLVAYKILPSRTSRPSKAASLVNWGSIERVETFSFPDQDAILGRGKSGLRLKIKDERIVIWENIRSFSQLAKLIEQNAHKKTR